MPPPSRRCDPAHLHRGGANPNLPAAMGDGIMHSADEIAATPTPRPSPAMMAGGLIAWLFVGSTVVSLLVA
jgi:hypothetical protein